MSEDRNQIQIKIGTQCTSFTQNLVPVSIAFPARPLVLINIVDYVIRTLDGNISLIPFVSRERRGCTPDASPQVISSIPTMRNQTIICHAIHPQIITFDVQSLIQGGQRLFIVFCRLEITVRRNNTFRFQINITVTTACHTKGKSQRPIQQRFLIYFHNALFISLD